MLMGFADLVFEHGGRYWVLDYKSNWLGDGDAAYTPDALEAAMASHRYDVQAAIYLLALHRLLRSRLGAAYDPARQLGGAIFLFLRGINGPTRGCHLSRPSLGAARRASMRLLRRDRATAAHERMSSLHPIRHRELLDELRRWSEQGWMRRLDSAFARFVVELVPGVAAAAACWPRALLAHLEGRGHSCLPLDELLRRPAGAARLAPPSSRRAAAADGCAAGHAADWLAMLRASPLVQVDEAADDASTAAQPLVLRGDRALPAPLLALRDGGGAAQVRAARAATRAPVDRAAARGWLDRLFAAPARRRATRRRLDWQKAACALALRGSCRSSPAAPAPARPIPRRACWRCCSRSTRRRERLRIALAAPTGKAAARLKQSIDEALPTLQTALGDALPLRELAARIGPARTLHCAARRAARHAPLRPRRGAPARRRRADRRRGLDGPPRDDGRAARCAAAARAR